MKINSRLMSLVAAAIFLFCGRLYASDCPALPVDIKAHIETYLTGRLVSAKNPRVSVVSMETTPQNCFRLVTVTIPEAASPMVFYLSPDGRYLTSTVYDLSEDPKEEVSRIASNVRSLLMRDESPRRSGRTARVTLVEFGDLQCPYAKRFAEWYASLPDSLRDQTTLVFKHLPLEQHAWARPAALLEACVGFESTESFWQVSDFLFANQKDITPENLEDKAMSYVSQHGKMNLPHLKTCLRTGTASTVADRDISVAKQLNVRSTPTIFIDGRRVLSLSSAEELRRLLEEALSKDDSNRNGRQQQAAKGVN